MKKSKGKVHVLFPLPDREKLIANCKYYAKSNNRTLQDELRFYIQCRIRDIEKQKLEIAKSKIKIERHNQCIKIAESIIAELSEV